MTPVDSGRRVVRGSTWYHDASNLRAAHRDDLSATRWDADIGFRTFRRVRERTRREAP